ncbi:MAG: GNAT family N-acetyltransferase [Candidatus Marinimicrobia bacterium]|nr:GNAT family N-acetyltransferase [Candidatus Neomarinimicrobiota bacterium]
MEKESNQLFDILSSKTKSKQLAYTNNGISIELVERLGESEYSQIIAISEELADIYGSKAKFTRSTITKYFNFPQTFPLMVRYNGVIEGFIIGIPLEHFAKESWAHCDSNFGKNNTVYTYAFIVKKDHRKLGLAKMLKRVYQSYMKKIGFKYISGHVREGVALNFKKSTQILKKFPNWNGTGYTFEYYRCPL